MKEREERIIDLPIRDGAMQERYLKNIALERKIYGILDDGGHINGQCRFPVSAMRFGRVTAGFASCEVIAVYNVLRDLGRHIHLSELILYDEAYGFISAGGVFGTKIRKIGELLDKADVRYVRMPVKEFLNAEHEFGQKYILTIRTRTDIPISRLHTFEAVHYRGNWVVFNRFDTDHRPRFYDSVEDILKNGRETGAVYAVYKITE